MLNLPTNLNEIKKMKKVLFKKLVKNNAKVAALKYLEKFKVEHSKMKNLSYKSLNIQPYLTSTKIYPQVAKQAFKWRTRMMKFKANFPNGTDDLQCPLGCLEDDRQERLLSCPVIVAHHPELAATTIKYFDIFSGDPAKIRNTTDNLMKVFKIRETLIESQQQQNIND